MQLSRVLGTFSVGLIAMAVTQPALAFAPPESYYNASNPLTAFDDGVAQAQMYGLFYVQDSTYLRNNTTQRDPRPGGDSVFERTEFWFYMPHQTTGEVSWQKVATQQGAKTDSSAWFSQYDRFAIVNRADKGRMRTQVCEDHGVWKDPCSKWPQFTTGL